MLQLTRTDSTLSTLSSASRTSLLPYRAGQRAYNASNTNATRKSSILQRNNQRLSIARDSTYSFLMTRNGSISSQQLNRRPSIAPIPLARLSTIYKLPSTNWKRRRTRRISTVRGFVRKQFRVRWSHTQTVSS